MKLRIQFDNGPEMIVDGVRSFKVEAKNEGILSNDTSAKSAELPEFIKKKIDDNDNIVPVRQE